LLAFCPGFPLFENPRAPRHRQRCRRQRSRPAFGPFASNRADGFRYFAGSFVERLHGDLAVADRSENAVIAVLIDVEPEDAPPSAVVSTGPSDAWFRTVLKRAAGVTPPVEVVASAHAQSASNTRQELCCNRFIPASWLSFMKES
jgi:hypothetical protein